MPKQSKTTPSTSQTDNITKDLPERYLLELNDMSIEDFDVKDRDSYAFVKGKTESIVSRMRNSPAKNTKSSEFAKLSHELVTRGELTWIDLFFNPLIDEDRNVKTYPGEDEDDNPVWQIQSWRSSGMNKNCSWRFMRGSLPKLETGGNKIFENLLKTHDRIKNPAPDRAYGYHKSAFSPREYDVIRMFDRYTGISEWVWLPGVIIEFGREKSMATVEAQCACGAAALANAGYQMRIAAGDVVSQGGADLDTVVYSFAVTQSNVHLSAHWAEFTDSKTIFHMHFYDDYGLRKGESIMRWRHDFNNVLEWLIGDRLTWFKGILGRIIQKGQAAIIPQIIALESATENQS